MGGGGGARGFAQTPSGTHAHRFAYIVSRPVDVCTTLACVKRTGTHGASAYVGLHAHTLSPGAYDPVNSSAGVSVSVSVSVNNLQVSSTTWRCRSCLPPTGLYASTALHMQTNWPWLHEPGLLKRWHVWLQSLAVAMGSTSTSLAGPKGATGTACTTRNFLKKRWRNRAS